MTINTKYDGERLYKVALNTGLAWVQEYNVYADNEQSAIDTLADYLENKVFAGNTGTEIAPTPEDVAGFNAYIANYKRGLAIEQAAVENKK